ncbi:TadE/TadG family type IV pilus assembly protein [Streptomyces sp. NPDC093085]|uniref:TadE/TadG family type IV pilus assembly protein n=1 Tax=Streptomyces sp. NPDC093085 TaxID=3155068 RepID=UPI00341D084A
MRERENTTARPQGRRRRRDAGQVAIEYVGFIPLLLIVGLLAIQLGIAAYTANQAGTAARVAARTASQDWLDRELTPDAAARSSISRWLRKSDTYDSEVHYNGRDVTYTVKLKIPSVIPGMEGRWGKATRSSTMPVN